MYQYMKEAVLEKTTTNTDAHIVNQVPILAQ